MVNHLVKKF